jgi:hypothetical protein
MNGPYLAALVLGAVLLGVLFELLRRRRLREKYAALWIVVGLLTLVLAVVPGLLTTVAQALGFALPANLLFLLGGVLLTTISLQLSGEVGRLEDESQRLAEEVALLRLDLDQLTGGRDQGDHRPPPK